MRRMILTLTGLMVFLVGCGTDQQEEQTGEADGNDGDVSVRVETDEQDEGLGIRITVQNEKSEPVDLTFRSGHQFDIRIYDEQAEKLYDFAEGMMFTEAIIEEQLQAGESLTFEDVWSSYSKDLGPLRIETEVLADEFDLTAEAEHP